jgi:hypothetical protein
MAATNFMSLSTMNALKIIIIKKYRKMDETSNDIIVKEKDPERKEITEA